jgi:hypothetical protein
LTQHHRRSFFISRCRLSTTLANDESAFAMLFSFSSVVVASTVAIYPPGDGLQERTVFGSREDAKITARSMINAWLKKRLALASQRE